MGVETDRTELSTSSRPPSTPVVVREIARMTWRLFFNDLARSLGSRAGAGALLGGMVVTAVAFAGWSTAQSAAQLGVASLAGVETTYGALFFTIPALVTILIALYTPDATLLGQMLTTLPVKWLGIVLAQRVLTVSVGLPLGLFVLVPLLSMTFSTSSVAPLAASLLLGVGGSVVAAALHSCFTWLVRRIWPGSGAMGSGLAALATTTILLWPFVDALPMNYHEPGGSHSWLTGGLIRAMNGGALAAALPFGLLVLAALVLAGLVPQPARQAQIWARSPARSAPGVLGRSLVGLELVQILRFAPNAVSLFFLNGVALAALVHVLNSDGEDLGLAALLLMALSAWGVGAYGPTRSQLWQYELTGRPHAWIPAKVMAVAMVWAVMMLVHGTWIVLLTGWWWQDVVFLLPVLAVEMVLACTVGIVVPVSAGTSISAAVSEVIAILVLLMTATGTQTALAGLTDPWLLIVVHLTMLVAALALYVLTARFQGRPKTVRA